jgi:hypothetical protein
MANKMEGTTPTIEPIATPQVATPTPQVATPTPTPTPTPTTPIMAEGGTTSEGGIKGFFKELNWIEAGLTILGVASLSYVIYYYRFKLKQDKMINNELQRQIDEIKMNVQSSLGKKYKSI